MLREQSHSRSPRKLILPVSLFQILNARLFLPQHPPPLSDDPHRGRCRHRNTGRAARSRQAPPLAGGGSGLECGTAVILLDINGKIMRIRRAYQKNRHQDRTERSQSGDGTPPLPLLIDLTVMVNRPRVLPGNAGF